MYPCRLSHPRYYIHQLPARHYCLARPFHFFTSRLDFPLLLRVFAPYTDSTTPYPVKPYAEIAQDAVDHPGQCQGRQGAQACHRVVPRWTVRGRGR